MGLTATRVRAAKRNVPKSRGGRPTRDAAIERDQRLIEVATRLFLDRGFDATSIDAVAEAARVSKPTVYAQYGDKRGLFAAVLRREIARWLAPLAAAAAEMHVDSASDNSVEQRLTDLGRQLLQLNCGDDAIAFSRILTAQAINFPEIAKLAVDEGWSKAVATTAEFFDHLVGSGALDLEDTTIAAETFLNMVVGHTHRMATFGIPMDMRTAEKRMEVSIRLFLAGALGPPGRAPILAKANPRRRPAR
ncbi:MULTISPECIES: TetR/AcrR family transcriptional regulator [unclassified Bradyrhizobium]|uniref:TetR/AcrR family transcriptional regulator n=1 Tax=unclassified Bradyrhizobium TaxID=2631580 RepID=UPI00247AEB37|nr:MULTISPECIES: TetR/AcrR family transcriptional regulator [unclassified Bradyrhizobium]WGS17247.1 TetR/AcrR family transcriptional regulator [Bradyrhizobium sp. ISRA463]WGS30983.1 TetR/AcrR family transcriptional regulator [Bradyrhizobium sp. ISRA464]